MGGAGERKMGGRGPSEKTQDSERKSGLHVRQRQASVRQASGRARGAPTAVPTQIVKIMTVYSLLLMISYFLKFC